MKLHQISTIVLIGLLANCTTRSPAPPVLPAQPLPHAPAPPLAAIDWRDIPETAGRWSYGRSAAGSAAQFGRGGTLDFSIRCDRAAAAIVLTRTGAGAGPIGIRTSYGERALPGAAVAGGAAATLRAADPLLDQIAFSRGRFTVTAPGVPMLVLPAWAEPSRVIEDCR